MRIVQNLTTGHTKTWSVNGSCLGDTTTMQPLHKHHRTRTQEGINFLLTLVKEAPPCNRRPGPKRAWMAKSWRLGVYRIWFHGQLPIFSFTHTGLKEHCGRGSEKIIRAREVIQDQMEMNPTSSWDPVPMNLQHWYQHAQDSCKLSWTKTQHRTADMSSRAQSWLRKYW